MKQVTITIKAQFESLPDNIQRAIDVDIADVVNEAGGEVLDIADYMIEDKQYKIEYPGRYMTFDLFSDAVDEIKRLTSKGVPFGFSMVDKVSPYGEPLIDEIRREKENDKVQE